MAGTSDIAIIGLVALMLSDKLSGFNLGGLFGSGTPADPKVEVTTTESITCTCADGFQMQSDSGDCIQSCESAGHGTKTTISEGEPTVRIKFDSRLSDDKKSEFPEIFRLIIEII